jgi:hypothetical protein
LKIARATRDIVHSNWREGNGRPSAQARVYEWRHEITLEVAWEPTGPGCWYISTPGFEGVCPVGLFVKV